MGFRLEMGKEVITKCLAGSWCLARPGRDVENHLSPCPPPWAALPHGLRQQQRFAPSAPKDLGWHSALSVRSTAAAGRTLSFWGTITVFIKRRESFSGSYLRTYSPPHHHHFYRFYVNLSLGLLKPLSK